MSYSFVILLLYYTQMYFFRQVNSSLEIRLTAMHIATPKAVGSKNDASVHFKLPVSFFTVIRVVEHGQCIKKNTTVHIQVVMLQPFAQSISFTAIRFKSGLRTDDEVYKRSAVGRTISLAGIANKKAVIRTPSMPMHLPIGAKNSEIYDISDASAIFRLHIIYRIIPDGKATAQALPRTKIVRSRTERTTTSPQFGIRYGGSSIVKDDGTPLRTVWERKIINVFHFLIVDTFYVIRKRTINMLIM